MAAAGQLLLGEPTQRGGEVIAPLKHLWWACIILSWRHMVYLMPCVHIFFRLWLLPLAWKLSSANLSNMVAEASTTVIFLKSLLFIPTATIWGQPSPTAWSYKWLVVFPSFWLPLKFALLTETRVISLTDTSDHITCLLQVSQTSHCP